MFCESFGRNIGFEFFKYQRLNKTRFPKQNLVQRKVLIATLYNSLVATFLLRTPLMLAVINNRMDLVKILLASYADVTHIDLDFRSAALYAKRGSE